jgi:hypothetical protein
VDAAGVVFVDGILAGDGWRGGHRRHSRDLTSSELAGGRDSSENSLVLGRFGLAVEPGCLYKARGKARSQEWLRHWGGSGRPRLANGLGPSPRGFL